MQAFESIHPLFDGLLAALPFPPAILAAAALAILVSAFLRGFTGFGFAIAGVPLLSLIMPPARAVPIVLCLQLFGGLVDFPSLMRLCNWRSLRWLGLGATLGTPVGMLGLHLVSADMARITIALLSVLAVVMLARGLSLVHQPGRPATTLVGIAAGLSNGLAAMPGPPVIAYYMALPFGRDVIRASLIMFFTITSAIALAGSVPFHLVSLADSIFAACMLLVMWIGTRLGAAMLRYGSDRLHKNVSMAVLALIALATGWKGLSGLL